METCPDRGKAARTSPVRLSSFLVSFGVFSALAACEAPPADRVVTASTDTNVVIPKVTWPTGAKIDARAVAALGDATRATELLARSPAPVLAPTNVTFERPTFVVGAEYYALTGRVSGTTIAIQGTRAARRYEGVAPVQGDRLVRGSHGFVSTNESIRTVSWIENGIAYSVDIECADPTDTRCTNDAFALDIVENLGFAGGGAR